MSKQISQKASVSGNSTYGVPEKIIIFSINDLN